MLLPAALLAVFAAQALWHARNASPTYDEPGHLAASYLLAETDHQDYDVGHPPFLRTLFSVPLRFLDPGFPAGRGRPEVPKSVPLALRPSPTLYTYAAEFLYASSAAPDQMIFLARCVTVCLGVLLGIWVYLWSSDMHGRAGGVFSLALFALCPNLIAHGSLVTTDLGGVAFAVGFLYYFTLLLKKPGAWRAAAAGAVLGLALLCKHTNLYLAPFAVAVLPFFGTGAGFKARVKEWARLSAVLAFTSWMVVCAGYGFREVFTPHVLQEEDWSDLGAGPAIRAVYSRTPLPDSFLRGVAFGVHHNGRGHGAFFMGRYGGTGWPAYFPVAFLAKSPLAVLIFSAVWVWVLLRTKNRLSPSEIVAALAGLLLMANAMNAKINIGVRHVLLCYPLLYVLLGRLAALPWAGSRGGRAAGAALLCAMAYETFSVAPHYLAFFNRAAGGPAGGARLLSDSNIDWGQDLKHLARFMEKEGNPELLLSYFGTAVPMAYGLRYQELPAVWTYPSSPRVNSAEPGRELCAVSVTNLQGTYFSGHSLYKWLWEKEPLARIGWSIHVYDVTDDLESQKKFLEIYAGRGDREKAFRQAERVRRLEKKLKLS